MFIEPIDVSSYIKVNKCNIISNTHLQLWAQNMKKDQQVEMYGYP